MTRPLSKPVNYTNNFIEVRHCCIKTTSIYHSFGGFQGFGGGTMARLFRALCNRVNTQAKLDKVRGTFKAKYFLSNRNLIIDCNITCCELLIPLYIVEEVAERSFGRTRIFQISFPRNGSGRGQRTVGSTPLRHHRQLA